MAIDAYRGLALSRGRHRWIAQTADGQRESHAAVIRAVEKSLVEAGAYTGLLFNRLDGRDYQDAVWRLIEPEFERPS